MALANSLGVFGLGLSEERTSSEAAASTSKVFKGIEDLTDEELKKSVVYTLPRGSVGISNAMKEMNFGKPLSKALTRGVQQGSSGAGLMLSAKTPPPVPPRKARSPKPHLPLTPMSTRAPLTCRARLPQQHRRSLSSRLPRRCPLSEHRARQPNLLLRLLLRLLHRLPGGMARNGSRAQISRLWLLELGRSRTRKRGGWEGSAPLSSEALPTSQNMVIGRPTSTCVPGISLPIGKSSWPPSA